MPLRTIKFEMMYWVGDDPEDNKLVIDAATLAVTDVRAVAQTLTLTSDQPAPRIVMEVTDEENDLVALDPVLWQQARAAALEDDNG